MSIVSLEFAVFAAVCIGIYYLLPRRAQNWWLLLASYVFYISLAWEFAAVLACLTLANFVLAFRVNGAGQKRVCWLWTAIGLNLVALAVFKYGDFFVPQVVARLAQFGFTIPTGDALHIILPVGFSFLILQAISFQVDIHRGQLMPATDLVDFALYLAYFPKLTAGPIERAREFLPKLAQPRVVDNQALGRAFALVVIGLVRKVIIAEGLARLLPDDIFRNPLAIQYGTLPLITSLIAYGFYLYNDFAGYTSIVRGVSLLLGIELTSNFEQPFAARNFTEFWNRWHISLSHWLRDYIYYPVTRSLMKRNARRDWWPNLVVPPLVTMCVSGLWHGASLHLLVWGLLHGIYQVIERVQRLGKPITPLDTLPRWRQGVAILSVFSLVTLAWLPFRTGLSQSAQYLQGIVIGIMHPGITRVNLVMAVPICLTLWLDWMQHHSKDELFMLRWRPLAQGALLALAILVLALTMLGTQPSQFVYQEF